MSLTRREKWLLIAFCVAVAAVVFYRFFWQTAWPRYLEVKESLAAERQTLAQAQHLASRVEDLKHRTAEAQAALRQARRTLAFAEGEWPLGRILTALPPDLDLKEMVPEAEVRKEFYRIFPVRLKVVGGYSGVEAFLARLDQMPVHVRELQLSAGEDGRTVEAYIYLDWFGRAETKSLAQVLPGEVLRNPFRPPSEAVPLAPKATSSEGGTGGVGTEGATPQGKGPDGGSATGGKTPKSPTKGDTPRETGFPVRSESATASSGYSFPVGKGRVAP